MVTPKSVMELVDAGRKTPILVEFSCNKIEIKVLRGYIRHLGTLVHWYTGRAGVEN